MIKSLRLNEIYSLLDKNKVTADIGCDHGLLIFEYALNNDVKCYGIDNKEGPINQAKKNLKEISKTKKVNVELLCSDGLNDLKDDVKQIIVSGMGGQNIVNILSSNLKKLENIDTLLFEANCDNYVLRKFLSKHNFKIIVEKIIRENEYIYEIIKVTRGQQKLKKVDCYFGPLLRMNKNDIFYEKYRNEYNYLRNTVNNIPKKYWVKRSKFIKQIKMIKKEI